MISRYALLHRLSAVIFSGLALILMAHLFELNLMYTSAHAAPVQTASTSEVVLVKDPGDVNTQVRGALVKIPSSMREYMVKVEYQQVNGEDDRYRRVSLYSRSGNQNCLHRLCWRTKRTFSKQSNNNEERYRRSQLKEFLVTAWGHNSGEGNSKGGAAYSAPQIEESMVSGKRRIKLTFNSEFGTGTTTVSIQQQ
jgi:hypothetical protein